MVNGHGEETPESKIATAHATLCFAMRLNGEVNQKRISVDIFKQGVNVITSLDGKSGFRVPPMPEGTEEDLKHAMFNIMQIALSTSALTADDTLEEAFGPCTDDKEPSRVGIRILVNQMRNAFAHNPWRPKWKIYAKYRNQYPIELYDGSKFTLDTRSLDGQSLKPEDVGGLEFWGKVLEHCKELVNK